MQEIRIAANAKINLALAIKYRRPDGYHEIESIFQEIDFSDHLIIKKYEGIRFTSNLKSLETDPSNLCVAATRLMMESFGISGLSINLDKKIPIGAGLGGGSSDAAAVLKAAAQLFELNLGRSELIPLAEQLGSDVPFFLNGKTAWVTGRGEKIQPIAAEQDYFLLLVLPEVRISTVWAYKKLNLNLTKEECKHKFIGFNFHEIGVTDFKKYCYNDFERTLFVVFPELAEIKQRIYDAGADFAALSGSGSTVFGVFQSRSQAEKACNLLESAYTVQYAKPILGL